MVIKHTLQSKRFLAVLSLIAPLSYGAAQADAFAEDRNSGSTVAETAPAENLFAHPSNFSAASETSAALPNAPEPAPAAPAAPSAIEPVAVEKPLAISRNYRPAWAVDHSRLGSKASYYLSSTVSFRNLAEAFLIAGIPNLPSAPSQPEAPSVVTIDSAGAYGDEMNTYGDEMTVWTRSSNEIMRYRAHRLETGIATVETRDLLSNLVLPVALHQQARYIPAPIDSSFDRRMENAAASIVVTRSDRGSIVPNYSKLVGTVAAAYIGKNFYAKQFDAPELNSTHFVTRYIGYSLLGDFATNAAREMMRSAIAPDMEVYSLHGRSTEDSYYPLSTGGKFVYWARSTYAPRVFIQAALTAGLPSWGTEPVQPPTGVIKTQQQAFAYDQVFVAYGSAIEGWRQNLENNIRFHEHRLIGGLSEAESQMMLQNLILPMAFDIDPRYIPLGSGYTSGARLGHAFEGIAVARTDSGGHTVNLPVLGGTVGAAYLAKEVYYPALGSTALESGKVLGTTITLNLVADIIGNVASEFLHHRGY